MIDYKKEFYRYQRYYTRIQPLISSERFRAYSSLILSLFMMAFLGFFAVKPTLKTITLLRREIKDSQRVNKALEKKINNLSLAQSEYLLIKNDIYVLDQALPIDPKMIPLIQNIEKLSASSSASISAMRLPKIPLEKDKTATISALIPLEFDLSLNSFFENVISFVTNMQNLRRIVNIESLNLHPEGKESDVLGLEIKAKTFYQK